MSGALVRRNRAGAEARDDGALESVTFAESVEDCVFLALKAAEIDGVVEAMDREKDRCGFEARNGGNFFAFLALGHGVAGDVGGGVVLDGEEEVVNGIAEIEEADVGLEAETEYSGIGAGEGVGGDRRERSGVEGFDFGPFEPDHVEGEYLAAARVLRMFAEPGFEA